MRVFPDTNVLFSARLINLVMRAHAAELIDVVWSDDLMAEVVRVFVERKRMNPERATSIVRKLQKWAPNGRIPRQIYAVQLSRMTGSDSTDHLHAAAARYGNADVLLTNNVRDFPRIDVGASCRVVTPSALFAELCREFPEIFVRILHETAAQLRTPRRTVDELIDDLEEIGLADFANLVRRELSR